MSSYRGLHARSNGVENRGEWWAWQFEIAGCGMGKRQRLRSSKLKGKSSQRPTFRNQRWGTSRVFPLSCRGEVSSSVRRCLVRGKGICLSLLPNLHATYIGVNLLGYTQRLKRNGRR